MAKKKRKPKRKPLYIPQTIFAVSIPVSALDELCRA
jgi:hypothetical protein